MAKKIISTVILVCALFSLFSFKAFAFDLDVSKSNIDGYYLYNFENDLVMAQSNANDIISASSTVKMMTACVALESNVPLDQVITVTAKMLNGVSGRFMGLKVGDKLTFEDLLYCMICASFNDAAHAIALTVDVSSDAFISRMNAKACELGMNDTFYTDFTGVSGASKTNINDTVKLAKHLATNEKYVEISSTKSVELSSVATCDYTRISNRSALLSSYKGLANFNTGSSENGGDSAVHYYNNGKISLLCIVFNASPKYSYDKTNYAEHYTKELLNHGIYDYSLKTIIDSNKVIDSLPIKYSITGDKINLYLEKDLVAYLPDDTVIDDSFVYDYYLFENELSAPIRSGDIVGVLVLMRNGKMICSENLVVEKDVDRNFFLYMMDLMKSYVGGRAFLITVITFLIMLGIYYLKTKRILDKMYKRQRKKKKR